MGADSRQQFNRFAGGGAALLLTGALVTAVSPPDSWPLLAGFAALLAGLLCLYAAIWLRMRQYMRRENADLSRAGSQRAGGLGIAALRILLILIAVGSAGVWLWSAGVDLTEVGLLAFNGKTVAATVVGRDIVPKEAVMGSVNYAYRVTPTLAVVDHFPILHSAYRAYWTGYPIDITYAVSLPRVHRLGTIELLYGLRRLLYWLLLLGNGAAIVLLPLWILEFRRRPADRRASVPSVSAAG